MRLGLEMSTATGKKLTEKEQQEIVVNFNRLRDEQRMIATKAAELQNEQKSHEFDFLYLHYQYIY